eukprot:3534597-Amphidinium_carterae.1
MEVLQDRYKDRSEIVEGMEQQQRLAPPPSLRQQRYLQKREHGATRLNARRSAGRELKNCLRDRHQ